MLTRCFLPHPHLDGEMLRVRGDEQRLQTLELDLRPGLVSQIDLSFLLLNNKKCFSILLKEFSHLMPL